MVLKHIPDRARRIVKSASPRDAKRLRHGDLHAMNIVAIPDWFKECVGKAEEKQILHGFLAKVMVNAEDSRFGKDRVQYSVQFSCGGKVVPERLFDNDARILSTARFSERFDNIAKQAWRNGQVMRRPGRSTKRFMQLFEGRGIQIVAIDVLKQLRQFGKGFFIDASPLPREAVVGASAKLIKGPTRFRNTDHRHIQAAAPDHVL